jgi:hypothetical protein
MNNLPQNATARYISNLLRRDHTDNFELTMLTRENALNDGIIVGTYYTVSIISGRQDNISADVRSASGVTPAQATSRCLKKFGVTFRE